MKKLGVENEARARFFADHLRPLGEDERDTLMREWTRKGLLSGSTRGQVRRMLRDAPAPVRQDDIFSDLMPTVPAAPADPNDIFADL